MIASVEDSLGVPSPEELATEEGTEGLSIDQETCRLAEGLCCTYSSLQQL